MNRYKRKFQESIEGYAVILLGGSIGSLKSIRSLRELSGEKYKAEILSKEDAILKAKRMNAMLSPGEKKYYGLKYVIAEVINGIFTGK